MTILKVDGLCRRYGHRLALRDVTFQAGDREIIALMGRNGAGKSTLMNILTGYLAPTSGSAAIGGCDVQSEPLKARRMVGYLPETPPLYSELTVREYLAFCARLKGFKGAAVRKEIESVIERTGLTAYASRLSKALSKGYRQRLGLAQALIGNPALLILDEPGNGLDPLQMLQMRTLITEVARYCTVLLSSHILSEVTNVCRRALVIDEGRLRYDGSMQTLIHGENRLLAVYSGGRDVATTLGALRGVVSVCVREGDMQSVEIVCENDADLRQAVGRCIVGCGADILELTPVHGGLENAFLHLLNEEVTP